MIEPILEIDNSHINDPEADPPKISFDSEDQITKTFKSDDITYSFNIDFSVIPAPSDIPPLYIVEGEEKKTQGGRTTSTVNMNINPEHGLVTLFNGEEGKEALLRMICLLAQTNHS